MPSRFSALRRPAVVLALAVLALATALASLPGVPTARAADGARPSWVGNYETGDFSQFQRAPWNYAPRRPTIARSPKRKGRFIGRYEIRAGGSRSESVPRTRSFRPGQSRWFGFSTRLKRGFPTSTSAFQVLAQWKNDGEGSPPLQLNVSRGRYQVSGGWGWPGTNSPSTPKLAARDLGRARPRRWDDWLVRVKFSSDPSVGFVSVWRNGRKVVSRWHPRGGTLYPGLRSYLKVGYYRSTSIRATGVVFHDRWRTGRTRASVT